MKKFWVFLKAILVLAAIVACMAAWAGEARRVLHGSGGCVTHQMPGTGEVTVSRGC